MSLQPDTLIQLAALGLVGSASLLLQKASSILGQATTALNAMTSTVDQFRDEVRDMRAEVRELRDYNDDRAQAAGFLPRAHSVAVVEIRPDAPRSHSRTGSAAEAEDEEDSSAYLA